MVKFEEIRNYVKWSIDDHEGVMKWHSIRDYKDTLDIEWYTEYEEGIEYKILKEWHNITLLKRQIESIEMMLSMGKNRVNGKLAGLKAKLKYLKEGVK